MAYSALTSGETDADSPVDQPLWTKVKDNFDFLKTQSEGQTVNTQDGEVAVGATSFPIDDTIPQNTEGDEYMTLSITPNSATSKLKIDVVVFGATNTNTQDISAGLFQDTTAGALAAGFTGTNFTSTAVPVGIVFTHYMTSGTTSATTFKVRAGTNGGANFTFNGFSNNRKFGGVMSSSITITEIP